MSDDAALRQHRRDIGKARVTGDYDCLRFRQRAGNGEVAVEPITPSPQHEEGEKYRDPRPGQEAQKTAHQPRPLNRCHWGAQGGPAKISDALVPPKPNELERA